MEFGQQDSASGAMQRFEREQLDALFSTVYEELRRVAANLLRSESCYTLSPTGLVHEAWLRLKASPALAQTTPQHFKNIAAHVIRQVLIEAARSRNAQKRGGPERMQVTLDESMAMGLDRTLELLQVDESLRHLEAVDVRQARLAELKLFSELTNPEIAEEMGISLATVERDWRVARAWLKVYCKQTA